MPKVTSVILFYNYKLSNLLKDCQTVKNFSLTVLFLLTVLIIPFIQPISLAAQDVDSRQPVTLFDLSYTLKMDPDNPESVEKSWDHAHAIATLQGIVNRKAPRLYLFFF